jgi:hypothetical protein
MHDAIHAGTGQSPRPDRCLKVSSACFRSQLRAFSLERREDSDKSIICEQLTFALLDMLQQINLVVPAEYDQGRIMDGIHHTHIWQILCYGRNQFHLTLESGVGPSNAATIVWDCTERAVVNPKGVGVGHLRSFADTREQCRGAQRAERQEVGVYLVVFVRELDLVVAASFSEESATACVVERLTRRSPTTCQIPWAVLFCTVGYTRPRPPSAFDSV